MTNERRTRTAGRRTPWYGVELAREEDRAPVREPTVSIVVPVRNGIQHLPACLEAIRRLDPAPLECIVVDDGSEDSSAAAARCAGVRVLSTGGRRGPAVARNLGARVAQGELLWFLDADVVAASDGVARIRTALAQEAGLDAVIGSYDDAPGSPDFCSQYRNLLHAFVHQHSREDTDTFWTGCGAIRRAVFEAEGGFRDSYAKPYLEDIEFGWRLRQAGRRIRLDKALLVKHLKRWGFWTTLKTDLLDRAAPWTELIFQYRRMPADLNLRWEHRASVVLVCGLVGLAAAEGLRWTITGDPAPWWAWAAAAASGATGLTALNHAFYRYLAARRGVWFALRALPMHALHYLVSGIGFGIGMLRYVARRPAERVACWDSNGSSK